MTDAAVDARPQKEPFKLDLGRIGIFVAVPVILWAFYTTSSGMIDIMSTGENDWIGPIGATIGSAALLAMLALTSWSLGTDLAALLTRRRSSSPDPLKVGVVSIVFLFVFAFSAFFSFTYYYKNIFNLSSKQITGERLPHALAAEIIPSLEAEIEAAYAAISKRIKEEEGGLAWFNSIDALIKAAGTGGTNLREAVTKVQEQNRREAEAVAAERADATAKLQAANRQVADAERELRELDGAIANLVKIIEPKKAEIVSLKATVTEANQSAEDARRGLDNRGPGCGPNCAGHLARAQTARDKIRDIESSLVQPLKDHAATTAKRDRLAAQMPVLRQSVTNLQSKLETTSPVKPAPVQMDVAGTVKALSEARDQFRANPTWATMRATKPPCDIILTSVLQASMAVNIAPNFNCEPQAAETRQLLTVRDRVLEGRETFTRQCTLERSELQSKIAVLSQRLRNKDKDLTLTAGLAEAGNLVETCVTTAKGAGLSEAQVQAFLTRSEQFRRNRSPERNKFEQARAAFWSGTPDATMAIGIAVAQDAFILILKLLAEIFGYDAKPRARIRLDAPLDVADRQGDSPEIRTLKLLLRESRPIPGDASRFELPSADAGLSRDVEDNLVAHLNRMIREGSAQLGRGGTYVLDNAVLRHIETQVRTAGGSNGEGRIMIAADPPPGSQEDHGQANGLEASEPAVEDAAPARMGAQFASGLHQYFLPKTKLGKNGAKDDPGTRRPPTAASPAAAQLQAADADPPLTFEDLRARRML